MADRPAPPHRRRGIGKRDEHLRSVDFFHVERYPLIIVEVTAQTVVRRADYGVSGNMIGMVGGTTALSARLVFHRAER